MNRGCQFEIDSKTASLQVFTNHEAHEGFVFLLNLFVAFVIFVVK